MGMNDDQPRARILQSARRGSSFGASFLPERCGKFTFLQISPSKWTLELIRDPEAVGPGLALEIVRIGDETVAWWMLRGSRPIRWEQQVGKA